MINLQVLESHLPVRNKMKNRLQLNGSVLKQLMKELALLKFSV